MRPSPLGITEDRTPEQFLADTSPGLVEALQELFDTYGPLGVQHVVMAMRGEYPAKAP